MAHEVNKKYQDHHSEDGNEVDSEEIEEDPDQQQSNVIPIEASGDESKPDSEWEIIETNEAPVCLGYKYFSIHTGNTMNTHTAIINRLKNTRPDLKEVFDVKECDFIMVFCPIVSRAGTDIEAAMQELHTISDTRPAVVMALFHTFDPECVLPDIGKTVNRSNTIIVNWRFHEDQGLLQCPKNTSSYALVINHFPTPLPVPDFTTLLFQKVSLLWDYILPYIEGTQEKQKTQKPELRLVMIGRTGSGKSAAGNTILGIKERKQASTSTTISHLTQQSTSTQTEVAGRKVTVMDTPDWFSSEFSLENLRQDVGHCVRLAAPGPSAFLLVISVKQPTGEETGMLEKVEECFGEECWKNTMILFTVTNNCENNEVQMFIQSGNQELKKLVEKCGNRFFCLNIKESEAGAQVSELLKKIEEMVEGSSMTFYSSKVYLETESEIKKMVEKANEKKARAEREMEQKQIEEPHPNFLLSELWKYVLTLKFAEPAIKNMKRE